ncbi:2-hydroxyacid dehydrogenase [Nocardia aobensis]|uniref:2-hydroxyacid dehydrogenase n=1 Tax=Nocardia aobensis TaxID=257277 RepID=A0ABW6P313_9NOCA
MAVTVLVPHEIGVAALAQLDGVTALHYRHGVLPPGAEAARVLIPDVPAGADTVALAHRLPELGLVQLLTSGADDWVGALPEGVLLSNARGAHGDGVAEWVLGALIALCRDFAVFARARQERRWATRPTGTLYGKKVLIVGAGDLAHALTRALAPFRTPVTIVARTARAGVHPIGALPALLPDHDIVVLAVPATARTRGLADAGMLARMPDGAILVNVSRGPVVDTEALVAELYSHRLRAALDVTDPEPLPPDHPLWGAPGLFLTPHVAGAGSHSTSRAYAVAAAQIERFLTGRIPDNLVSIR